MSRLSCVLSLLAVERRPISRVPLLRAERFACVVLGVTFTALLMAASAPAFAAVDWPGCLHAADPAARAKACTGIIESATDQKTLLRALNSRGNALCATADRCREAIPDFASVVQLAPDVAGYHDNLARALRAAQRYPDALQESDRAIGLAPKFAFVYVGKARTLAATGRGAEALAVVQVAMAVAPVDAGLLEYQGKLLGDLKRYPESYAAFDRALQLQPTRVSIYARRADVEIADWRSADAIRDLDHYPADGAEFNQVRDKLNTLRTSGAGENAVLVTASNTPGKPKVEDEAKEEKDLNDTPQAASRPHPADPAYEEESSPTWTKGADGQYHVPPDVTQTPSPPGACNLYAWTPLQRCIEDFHVENDPLPGGIPNPHRWNDTLAARGRALAAQHPEITWDTMRWKAIAEEEADKAHGSPQSDAPDADMDALNRPPPKEANATIPSAEVPKCNDPQVLSVMTATIDDFRTAFKKMNADLKSSSWGRDRLGSLDRWFVSIHNIRQRSYDATNNVRYCSATYIHNDNFLGLLSLMSIFVRIPDAKGICADAVTYQIERTLDAPDGAYVTHYCH